MILDTIVEYKRQEVAGLKAQGGPRPPDMEIAPPRGFKSALLNYEGVAVIAEAKKASPSKGLICPDFEPAAIARDYEKGGAQAMSVLTDEHFFQGSLSYIPAVRSAVNLPVLRKEFIIDEIQIREAALYGADAILLIAAILDDHEMADYLLQARELGLDVLVEAHDEREAERSLKAGADLIGINNRNLRDFTVDIETTFRVMAELPAAVPVVSESAIKDAADMRRLAEYGVCAALIGESLMRAPDRSQALRDLRQPFPVNQ
ncbi:Indole-3-glycerol phosphate synthase [hydrothermal vent metagenome]|uniref:indole-3-glycerol-phosphate synthase n=1 Tax=hydrothermal vent metagenome TaxID=652676 RepID=A0A3B0VAX4_9ZZZZ